MKKFMTVALATAMTVAMSATCFADGTEAQAVLTLNDSSWAAAESTPVTITGAGQYTISGTFATASALAQYSAINITNGEAVFGHDCEIIIDSIVFDGEEVKIADSYTCSADGDGVDTRVNIYNEWNNPKDLNVADAEKGYADNRRAGMTEDQVSAKLVSDDYISGDKTVTEATITFTVKVAAADSADVAPVAYLAAVVAVAGIAMVASKKRA